MSYYDLKCDIFSNIFGWEYWKHVSEYFSYTKQISEEEQAGFNANAVLK